MSAVTFNNVDFGSAYLQGSAPYTGFICPVNGCYEFRLGGWICGVGNSETECKSVRGVTTVYDQKWAAPYANCAPASTFFIVPNCQTGDVITFLVNENNTGAAITSITDNTAQSQGNFTAYILSVY